MHIETTVMPRHLNGNPQHHADTDRRALPVTVTEIFHSIQGESTWAGTPCAFVRLAGCPLRCVYCDTAYAFTGGDTQSIQEILDSVARYECPLVEVTGGEPLAQDNAAALLHELCDAGHTVLLETSGAFSLADVPTPVHTILDIKTPGSGERDAWKEETLAQLKPGDEVKIVITDRADYEWARDMLARHRPPQEIPVLFSAAAAAYKLADGLPPGMLAEWLLEDKLPVRMQLQMHKVLWPGVDRGV